MMIFYWTRFGVDFRASFFIGFIQAGNFLILAENPEFMETRQCCIHSGAYALCRVPPADPPSVGLHNKKALPLSHGGSASFAGCTTVDLFMLPAKSSFYGKLKKLALLNEVEPRASLAIT
jgi:hypothetical protein